MKKPEFHSSKFQKDFYDHLGQEKAKDGGILSCGYEERYDPRLLIDNEHAYKQLKKVYDEFFSTDRTGIILDLCTGSGIHLPLLHGYARATIGIDLSFGLLNRAREFVRELQIENIVLIQACAETLPLADNVCDAIVMIDAIHHVEGQEQVIAELSRVAKHNAPFLLIEPNVKNPLVFLAHWFPREERGALRLNTVTGLTRLLSPYLQNIRVRPFNYVASKKKGLLSRAAFQAIEWFCEKIFFFWPIRILIQGIFVKT